MALDGKPLEEITKSDLDELIQNKVREKKTIEYKQELPGGTDKEKKEFLADVSSFANAAGGHIVYGVKEKDGEPVKIGGLGEINADDEILRLEGIVRTGIQPRPGIECCVVDVGEAQKVLIIRVSRSWNLPHMVIYQGSSKFWSRNSAGKHQLDVTEIRGLFALSESLADRIRNFRAERLAQIVARRTPIVLQLGPTLVLHIVPVNAFSLSAKLNVLRMDDATHLYRLKYHNNNRYNIDGLLFFEKCDDGPGFCYTQLYRNDVIETVDMHLLGYYQEKREIAIHNLCRVLLERLQKCLAYLKERNAETPVFLMLTLLDVRGYKLAIGENWGEEVHPIDRDDLIIPSVMLESYDEELGNTMRPCFDAVWNAGGWSSCMGYDERGLFGSKKFKV